MENVALKPRVSHGQRCRGRVTWNDTNAGPCFPLKEVRKLFSGKTVIVTYLLQEYLVRQQRTWARVRGQWKEIKRPRQELWRLLGNPHRNYQGAVMFNICWSRQSKIGKIPSVVGCLRISVKLTWSQGFSWCLSLAVVTENWNWLSVQSV